MHRFFLLLLLFLGADISISLANSLDYSLTDNKYKYYYYQGIIKKGLGEYSDAYEFFSYCKELDGNRGEALYELGALNMQLKNYSSAITFYEAATVADPYNYWYNEALFFSLYSQPELNDKAIEQLEKMVYKFPDKGVLQLQLVELYSQDRQFEKLVALLDTIESKLGKSEQVSLQKFGVYMEMGDEQQAFNEVLSLCDAYPNDMRYKVLLANLYISSGKYKTAYKMLDKVLKKEPENTMALYALAEYYDKSGEEKKYLCLIKEIIVNSHFEDELRLNLMRQFIQKVESDENLVVPMFEDAVTAVPEDDQMPMLYTQYLFSIDKSDKAYSPLEQVLSIDPTNTAARLMLLSLAIRKNDLKAVTKLCEEGLMMSPETIEFYYYLSIAYVQGEEFAKALEVINAGVNLVSESSSKELVSELYAIQGDVLHELGEKSDLVYNAYKQSLQYNSSNLGVLNNYAYYLSVDKKDLDLAEKMSKQTVDANPKNPIFLDTYAWVLFEQKKYVEAKIFILQALEYSGDDNKVMLEHAGDIFYMLGEKDNAVKYWGEALKKDENSKELQYKVKKKKM